MKWLMFNERNGDMYVVNLSKVHAMWVWGEDVILQSEIETPPLEFSNRSCAADGLSGIISFLCNDVQTMWMDHSSVCEYPVKREGEE